MSEQTISEGMESLRAMLSDDAVTRLTISAAATMLVSLIQRIEEQHHDADALAQLVDTWDRLGRWFIDRERGRDQ